MNFNNNNNKICTKKPNTSAQLHSGTNVYKVKRKENIARREITFK